LSIILLYDVVTGLGRGVTRQRPGQEEVAHEAEQLAVSHGKYVQHLIHRYLVADIMIIREERSTRSPWWISE
jgi:hypothetical protein